MHCTFCRLEIKWIRNQRQELLNYNSLENTFWSSCWLCQEKLNKLLSPALYYLHRSGCSYNIPIEKKSWAPLLGYLFLTTFSERSRWWIECNGRSNDAQWIFAVWAWLFPLTANSKIEGGKGDYIKIITYIDFFPGGGA